MDLMGVRIPLGVRSANLGIGKLGLSHLIWIQETAGSNPAA